MQPIRWDNGALFLLDQTKIPGRVEYICCRDHRAVAGAIRNLSVRGAPAIGVAAAYGLVLGVGDREYSSAEELLARAKEVAKELAATRPTAVNLRWALERMLARLANSPEKKVAELQKILLEEAHAIFAEDIKTNRAIGNHGQEVVPDGARVLTYCNAGALATAGYGTALGVIRAAVASGKRVSVIACETRPLLQGARLTVWEMTQEKIPVTLITDNMASSLMARREADLVLVGADRIALNGDVANKIGTYGLAVLAKEHGLPFYVAAPLSTVDFSTAWGAQIPIEERDPLEVTHVGEWPVTVPGVRVWNPAFDITPARLVTAIITEKGVARAPYEESLARLAKREQ